MSLSRDPFGEWHIALARMSDKNVDALAQVALNLRKDEDDIIAKIRAIGGDTNKPPTEEQAKLYHRVFALKRLRLKVEEALNEAGLYSFTFGRDVPPS